MKGISEKEAQIWYRTQGLSLNDRELPARPKDVEIFKIPIDTGHRISLVSEHMTTYSKASELLVWFTDWGIWSSSERPHIFKRFCLSYGGIRPLIDTLAFFFDKTEFEDAVSFVTLGVLFLWDIYIAKAGGPLLHFSHDEMGLIKK